MKTKLLTICLLLVTSQVFGVDVARRVLATTETNQSYYNILGMNADIHYSKIKNPIKKNVIVNANQKRSGNGWSSACYIHTVNCNAKTIKLNKVNYYYGGSNCEGKKNKNARDRDLNNGSLPYEVLRHIYNVACIMR